MTEPAPSYTYRGVCPHTGQILSLPRTGPSEAAARQLMERLGHQPAGKMYGLLLGQSQGKSLELWAYSGAIDPHLLPTGPWVPPIPGKQEVAPLELATLDRLREIADEIHHLRQHPRPHQYQYLCTQAHHERQRLNAEIQSRRQLRHHQRLLHPDRQDELDRSSRLDSARKRQLKAQWQAILAPWQQQVAELSDRYQALRHQRRQLSCQLQGQLHASTSLSNFRGETSSLKNLQPQGLPTGAGECCAPKLLHYAASQGITPIALAEFWWGPAQGDKIPGHFYPACTDRCQPLMGFMLSGLAAQVRAGRSPLTIVYEDPDLWAIDKPAGLLSVPGRYGQDHVGARLQQQLEFSSPVYPVHRLDLDTSGLLLVAKNLDCYRHLAAAFADHQVTKIYHGLLAGELIHTKGSIHLPLAADPHQRPRQRVDWLTGKPSHTDFCRLAITGGHSLVEFRLHTGRTHQIRLHAAQGLGLPLWGDRLYGTTTGAQPQRLYLHAHRLTLPYGGQTLELLSPVPF